MTRIDRRRQHSEAVEVGERLRILPLWGRRNPDPKRIDLIIDPGPSFGAGDHPTTIIALELLENALARLQGDIPAPSMLDAGTGTGVLAIAAKALGTGLTVGFDIDPAAIYVAQRNVRLNAGLFPSGELNSPVHFFLGDAAAVRGEFTLVAANLVAPVLVRSAKTLIQLCGKYLLLSGIVDEMAAAVFAAYENMGMELLMRIHLDRWNGGLFRRRTRQDAE